MYASKNSGRNRYAWFDMSMERELQARNELEGGLRSAIPRQEIVPYFEQQIELVTGRISGFEVLARWEHPVRGLVSADNALLYVSNFQSQELSVYSIDDGKRIGPAVHVGDGPDGLAFSSNGKLLFAVDARSGDVAVIRTSDRSLFTLLPSGRSPNGIAIKAFSMH